MGHRSSHRPSPWPYHVQRQDGRQETEQETFLANASEKTETVRGCATARAAPDGGAPR